MTDKIMSAREIASKILGMRLTRNCPRHSDSEECEWCSNHGGKIYDNLGLELHQRITEALTTQAKLYEGQISGLKTLLRSTNHDPAFWQEKINALDMQISEQDRLIAELEKALKKISSEPRTLLSLRLSDILKISDKALANLAEFRKKVG